VTGGAAPSEGSKASRDGGGDAIPAANPARRGRGAVVGSPRCGPGHVPAAGARLAVPVLPGAAGRGLDGTVPLVAAAGEGVPSGSGVLLVGGVSCYQGSDLGSVASSGLCAPCFLYPLAALSLTHCHRCCGWMDVSVGLRFNPYCMDMAAPVFLLKCTSEQSSGELFRF
jgi:hypothetical protein